MEENTKQPIIVAENIHRIFGEGNLIAHVLKGVSVSVKEGEFLAIMGKSGAGKSTLMYQLSVLDNPSSGDLLINGVDVTKLSESEKTSFRLNTLGYIFQNYALVPDLSAEENVMLPLLMKNRTWDAAKIAARVAIDSVGMETKYLNLPSELSGGEQQRIAIARAIAGKPKILFADEPTANLDSVSGKQVVALLTSLHRDYGHTVVMVTHEPEYAQNCDRIIYLEDGEITSEEIL